MFQYFEKLTPTKKRELEILNKYSFFNYGKKSPSQSCMCFGLEINEGWFYIIEQLCYKIEQHIKTHPECRNFEVVQVKQKFGSLRFYTYGGDETIDKFVNIAEDEASKTCEICGKNGKTRNLSWIKVLCNKHYKERK